MKKFLQTTARFYYGTATLGHGNLSSDLVTLLPDRLTGTNIVV